MNDELPDALTAPPCPTCGAGTAAADAYCEACGAFLGAAAADRRTERDGGRVAAVSDVGLLRGRNEDSFALADGERGALAVVCDGVASSTDGRAAADVAAQVAADALAGALEAGGAVSEAAMRAAIAEARSAVAALTEPNEGWASAPACTLVAAVWDGREATIGWVGDSRAYLVSRHDVRQLTVDDSWAQEQVTAGAMSERTALAAPQAHAITNWLGADAPGGEAQVVAVRPESPSRLVLCSDGLWNHLRDPDSLTGLVWQSGAAPAPIEAARRLTEHALGDGGRDNVTVVVMEVVMEVGS